MTKSSYTNYSSLRPLVLGIAKLWMISLSQLPPVRGAPLSISNLIFQTQEEDGKDAGDVNLWLYLLVAGALVLLGGAFAGLTIALMGQDEIYLQVIRDSGVGPEKKHAAKVLRLLRRGKHWVLVTLLLGNVITNETLPIVLDRSLGGGWPAVLGSTVLIVIFGEIAPQSICVRYGLPIGSWMAPFVVFLMYFLAPVSWPTAKLLDYLLGQDHGTVYKRAGLKTLVSLHKSLGEAGNQLNTDEVTIISAVLDLKDKSVGSIMTPMDTVFTLSLDDVLDEKTMDDILSQGYSRIPIHHPDNDENFVGMLLVKMLITYDPEDAKPVRDFALATLPETRSDTSCLDIVNFFQEGKSHMVLVSDYPGDDHGALGVVTLEDVIEELIGEEIVDESDVFIDVHKAIRRSMPAPRTRIPKALMITEQPNTNTINAELIDIGEGETLNQEDLQRAKTLEVINPKPRNSMTLGRRRSSAANSYTGDVKHTYRTSTDELREHLKHLGPSNLASRPRTTRYNTVKIKPGSSNNPSFDIGERLPPPPRRISESATDFKSGFGEGTLASAGKDASDGVQALHQGNDSLLGSPDAKNSTEVDKGVQVESSKLNSQKSRELDEAFEDRPIHRRKDSGSTIASLPDKRARSRSPYYLSKGPARSGSITENIVDTNGIRKVVLETTSSSDSNEDEDNSGANKSLTHLVSGVNSNGNYSTGTTSRSVGEKENKGEAHPDHQNSKKKKRRRRKKPHDKGEQTPLLG